MARPDRALVTTLPLTAEFLEIESKLSSANAHYMWLAPGLSDGFTETRKTATEQAVERRLESVLGSCEVLVFGEKTSAFERVCKGRSGLNGLHPWIVGEIWERIFAGRLVVETDLLREIWPYLTRAHQSIVKGFPACEKGQGNQLFTILALLALWCKGGWMECEARIQAPSIKSNVLAAPFRQQLTEAIIQSLMELPFTPKWVRVALTSKRPVLGKSNELQRDLPHIAELRMEWGWH